MKNKVLVQISVPEINENYDIFLPVNRTIGNVINLICHSIFELSNGSYNGTNKTFLYNSITGEKYSPEVLIRKTDIKNGTKLILI